MFFWEVFGNNRSPRIMSGIIALYSSMADGSKRSRLLGPCWEARSGPESSSAERYEGDHEMADIEVAHLLVF